MNDKEKNQKQELPSLSKGVGGAGRVAGFLTDEKAQDTSGTLKRLLQEMGGKKALFLLALILTLVASLSQIFSPRIIGRIINSIAQGFGSGGGLDWGAIGQSSLILVTLYIINFIATYAASTSMVRITQNVVSQLRLKMNRKLNRVPLNYFDTISSGDISSLLTNDLDNVANTLQSGLTSSITALVMMVGVFLMMLVLHPGLAFLSLVIVPFSYFLVKQVINKAKPVFQKNARTAGQLNGEIQESFQGHDVVSAYHMEEDFIKRMAELNEELYDSEWKSSFISFMTRPAGDLILNINYALVSIVGGFNVINGGMNLGEFQAFIQYVRMFSSPFTQVLGIINTLMSALASAERIYSFLDAGEIQEFGTESLDPGKVQGNFELKEVNFGYDSGASLFNGVSIQVPQGQQFAIVGSTGAGKTTLVNLLMRFYDIQEGQITLDGKDTRSYAANEFRKAFTMVLQDTWLFEGSIRDNIAYGYPLSPGETLDVVSQEQIKEAAKLARADHFIESFPDGYDTILTEGGTNISQGQRQLLTIARAMIKKAPITILDEATSSVDTRTEVLIQEGMKQLTEQNTSFVIAHRLSTIRHADQIIVMDKGSIAEMGTHEELLTQNGVYAELYAAGQTT